MSKQQYIILSAIVVVLILAGAVYGAYYKWRGQNKQVACTMEAKLCPDGSAVGRSGLNCEFAECPAVKEQKITDLDCGQAKKYLDRELGVAFCYPEKYFKEQVEVLKEGNRIYVGGKTGQYVQVLSKDPKLDAKAGISQAILTGYPAKDCFINDKSDEQYQYITDNFPAGYYYIPPVGYPHIAKEDEPFWAGSEKCPTEYVRTNGIRYFLGDEQHPDKFLFFSIGQYGIPLDQGIESGSKLWQDTIRFIDAE